MCACCMQASPVRVGRPSRVPRVAAPSGAPRILHSMRTNLSRGGGACGASLGHGGAHLLLVLGVAQAEALGHLVRYRVS